LPGFCQIVRISRFNRRVFPPRGDFRLPRPFIPQGLSGRAPISRRNR